MAAPGSRLPETEARFREIVAKERENPPLDAFFSGRDARAPAPATTDLNLSIDTIAALNSSVDFGTDAAGGDAAAAGEGAACESSRAMPPPDRGAHLDAEAQEEVDKAEAFFLDPARYAVLVTPARARAGAGRGAVNAARGDQNAGDAANHSVADSDECDRQSDDGSLCMADQFLALQSGGDPRAEEGSPFDRVIGSPNLTPVRGDAFTPTRQLCETPRFDVTPARIGSAAAAAGSAAWADSPAAEKPPLAPPRSPLRFVRAKVSRAVQTDLSVPPDAELIVRRRRAAPWSAAEGAGGAFGAERGRGEGDRGESPGGDASLPDGPGGEVLSPPRRTSAAMLRSPGLSPIGPAAPTGDPAQAIADAVLRSDDPILSTDGDAADSLALRAQSALRIDGSDGAAPSFAASAASAARAGGVGAPLYAPRYQRRRPRPAIERLRGRGPASALVASTVAAARTAHGLPPRALYHGGGKSSHPLTKYYEQRLHR